MPQIQYDVDVSTDTTLTTTAETVVATLTGIATQRPGQTIALRGDYTVTSGTSTTAFTHRIREDSLTGAIVSEAQTVQISTAAGSSEDHEYTVTHAPTGDITNKSYVLTVAQVGAAANGSVTHAHLTAVTAP